MIPLRRDPKGPESHRLIFGCAGVKPTSEGKPQNHVSWFSVPAGTLCATWALRVALSAPPLVGCVPSGTLPRFLQLKSSLESAVEFIRVEKTAYRLLQETLGSTPQGPETSESHQPFVGRAGVKPTSERKRPKNHVSGSVFLQEHWCATWALRMALSAAAVCRLCSLRNTSAFSAIEIEFGICLRVHSGRKTRLSVAPRNIWFHSAETPKRPESHQPFFSCAGVKSLRPNRRAQNHASGSVSLQEHWRDLDAPTNRTLRSGAGRSCSFRNTSTNALRRQPPMHPDHGRQGESPLNNHDSSVPAGTFDGFCT